MNLFEETYDFTRKMAHFLDEEESFERLIWSTRRVPFPQSRGKGFRQF
jgi:hypothetical protein